MAFKPRAQVGIYAIVCKTSKATYIGSSSHIARRWALHLWSLRNDRHHNAHLQNAWNKYGEENFNFLVVEAVHDSAKLIEREQSWIDSCGARYNIALDVRPAQSFEAYQARRLKIESDLDLDEPHPLKQLERHFNIGSTFVASLLGIAYSTYAAYRSGSRELPLYHLRHVECLLTFSDEDAQEYIRHALGAMKVNRQQSRKTA